ncbi:hypothetical protein Taro_035675 [Colocasia esculenta]|uniref:ALA-interacting subunit n=1 Tax=Colocasia esculenta TaxID=4460 RepID=A0A843WJC5_COLES|nr:hypothetical protein [Colocasia esculenta]
MPMRTYEYDRCEALTDADTAIPRSSKNNKGRLGGRQPDLLLLLPPVCRFLLHREGGNEVLLPSRPCPYGAPTRSPSRPLFLEEGRRISMAPKGAATSRSDGEADSSAAMRNSKKPQYSRFTQQELPAWKPILTPGWVISTFTFISVMFIPIGLASLFASQKVVEIVDQYDVACIPERLQNDMIAYIQNKAIDKTCTRIIIVPKLMKNPVYIYYELENFYQNHRRYVKSRNDKQLRNKASERQTESCAPESYTPNGSAIVPCGLIAWSLFNDTYRFSLDSKVIEVNKKNIAWKSDKDNKFGNDIYPKNFQSGSVIGGAKLNSSIPLSDQEDLIVWMRTAALPTFRKLYGKIEVDLKSDEKITVTIQNNYNTYSFGGKKKLVLSTTSWIGGKNDFLGVAYLTIGGLSLFIAISFILIYVIKPRFYFVQRNTILWKLLSMSSPSTFLKERGFSFMQEEAAVY